MLLLHKLPPRGSNVLEIQAGSCLSPLKFNAREKDKKHLKRLLNEANLSSVLCKCEM